MDAVKFIEERKRMCYGHPCAGCPLFAVHRLEYLPDCNEWCMDHPKESVAVVEKWAEEHPRKTRQSKFLERWPDVKKDNDGVPLLSPCYMDVAHYRTPEGICNRNGNCNSCRKKYWMQEVE